MNQVNHLTLFHVRAFEISNSETQSLQKHKMKKEILQKNWAMFYVKNVRSDNAERRFWNVRFLELPVESLVPAPICRLFLQVERKQPPKQPESPFHPPERKTAGSRGGGIVTSAKGEFEITQGNGPGNGSGGWGGRQAHPYAIIAVCTGKARFRRGQV